MKICIFGAAGKTGRAIVTQALKKGYKVVGFDLNTSSLADNPHLQKIDDSVLEPSQVQTAVKGCDVVISELGVKPGNKNPIVSKGNKAIVEAMTKEKVKRFITQSAFGAHESWTELPLWLKLAHKTLLRAMSQDKERMEDIVTQSKLDWTIIRPIRLTNESAKKHWQAGDSINIRMNARIGREDVALYILSILKDHETYGKKITLTY